MSTREFAKQTGRQHGNVMTTVRGMIARGELNIPESTWIGDNGKALPEFRLSRFDFEKMAYRLKSSDIEVVRRHFGVREMKIEPAPVSVPLGMVAQAAVPASLKLVPPVGAIGFMPEAPEAITMSSREIAELTGKRHDHVMRDIRKMLEDLDISNAPKFGGVYTDSKNEQRPCFNLPRREVDILLTGYSVPLRAKVIDRWHELEAAVAKPTQPVNLSDASALRGLLLGYTEQVLQLEHKITEDAPKVEFYDNVAVAVGTQTVQEVAKEFGIGSTKFYKLLRDEKILMSHPNQNVPYQKHMDAGHFEVVVGEWKNQETGEIKLKPRSFVTAKGLIYLERRLNKLGHFRTTQVAA
ncbi:phage antirepressor KilAC domain-containing protein [Pseudomonas sp. NPDC087626]|uniref:phage antirepressor KilAC domain-containing protein n=1 Tax=Pseudomonas sp. NPDC087626 TaxID=3364444 RepID=UPI00380A9EC4